MGLAILFVIFYHTCYVADVSPLTYILTRYLYVGVDIFMCASGFGLCYALQKHSTIEFYKRRFLRIYPTYAILTLFVIILHAIGGQHFSAWDIFCEFSTLQYFLIFGGFFFDWYLTVSLYLYIVFPLFFRLHGAYTPSIYLILSFIFLALVHLPWPYQAFIARIGIFAYGMLMYRVLEEGKPAYLLIMNGLVFLLVAPLPFFTYTSFGEIDFIFSAGVTPLLLLIVCALLRGMLKCCRIQSIAKLLEWCGKNSLSLFVANTVTMHTISHAFHCRYVICYCAFQVIYSGLMISLDRFLMAPLIQRFSEKSSA